MKMYLFMDNYRGFSNTTVQLIDVNFLVGENSSGKTSLMRLLQILSNPTFFMGAHLGSGESAQFGHFNEVVSAHASDRSYFRIGFIEERDRSDKHGGPSLYGMLLSYKERAGIPMLSRITFSDGHAEVSISISAEAIRFRSADQIGPPSIEAMRGSFQRWSEEHAADDKGWEKLAFPKGVQQKELPLIVLLHFATSEKQAKGKSFFPFMLPGFGGPVVWIAPIRTKPRRTYDEPNTSYSAEGSHTPYVIRRMLESKKDKEKFRAFMDKIGGASGLFQSIKIKPYGDSGDAPFEVDAVLDDKDLNLSWMGYGVSQSLPIFVELLDRPKRSWFAIQQPEVHLHPRAQAALGDLFFEMALKEGKKFVIETHSDFTIDRFRRNYRRKLPKKEIENVPQSQILFFERHNKLNTLTPIPIGKRGELPSSQPPGYREFFVKEEMDLLGG